MYVHHAVVFNLSVYIMQWWMRLWTVCLLSSLAYTPFWYTRQPLTLIFRELCQYVYNYYADAPTLTLYHHDVAHTSTQAQCHTLQTAASQTNNRIHYTITSRLKLSGCMSCSAVLIVYEGSWHFDNVTPCQLIAWFNPSYVAILINLFFAMTLIYKFIK